MTIREGISCSYHYVGELSIYEVREVAELDRVIIAYERAGYHKAGRNTLFWTGRVATLNEAEFQEAICYGLERVKAMDSWPDLPEARKREIEAFYTLEPTE